MAVIRRFARQVAERFARPEPALRLVAALTGPQARTRITFEPD